jgi:bifunctional DNA-binding transcriptional regulator/antitoxin component of YhaV-PrlF toxin-antitoxin module
MSNDFHLVKLVSGNAGSKRITIPKEIVDKLGINDADYVALMYEGNKKAYIAPAKVTVEK